MIHLDVFMSGAVTCTFCGEAAIFPTSSTSLEYPVLPLSRAIGVLSRGWPWCCIHSLPMTGLGVEVTSVLCEHVSHDACTSNVICVLSVYHDRMCLCSAFVGHSFRFRAQGTVCAIRSFICNVPSTAWSICLAGSSCSCSVELPCPIRDSHPPDCGVVSRTVIAGVTLFADSWGYAPCSSSRNAEFSSLLAPLLV